MTRRILIVAFCAMAASGLFLAAPAHSAAASANTTCQAVYTVQPGDTLSAIGARYGVSYWQIATASSIANPNLIYPGQRLCIPGGTGGGNGGGAVAGPTAPAPTSGGATPAGICTWCPPAGYHAFAVSDYWGDPYAGMFGWCTWWVAHVRSDERFYGLGTYAYQWFWNAPARGFSTGYSPAVGATVIFQPWVAGAWGMGHAAHVEAVYGGGWFLVSEMNFGWNGGGWARVSYRYVHVGPGVGFIY